jgi:hypothetical protein
MAASRASRCRTAVQISQRVGRVLAHDSEVDTGFRKRSCANNKLERDDDSNRHPDPGFAFSHLRSPRAGKKSLFTQIPERSLDALVIELLIVGAKLIAAIGAAMEKLGHHSDRSMRLTFEPSCAPNVDRAIEIKVVGIVKEVADQQARHGLVADAQHFCSRADRCYVLIAPPYFVVETHAGNRCAIGVEQDPFGSRLVVLQVLRERHFHSGNQIDDHPHLLSLGSGCRRKRRAENKRTCKRESPDCLRHERSFLGRRAPAGAPIAAVALTYGEPQPNWPTSCEFPPAGDLPTAIAKLACGAKESPMGSRWAK